MPHNRMGMHDCPHRHAVPMPAGHMSMDTCAHKPAVADVTPQHVHARKPQSERVSPPWPHGRRRALLDTTKLRKPGGPRSQRISKGTLHPAELSPHRSDATLGRALAPPLAAKLAASEDKSDLRQSSRPTAHPPSAELAPHRSLPRPRQQVTTSTTANSRGKGPCPSAT